jgi:hypothetical protein
MILLEKKHGNEKIKNLGASEIHIFSGKTITVLMTASSHKKTMSTESNKPGPPAAVEASLLSCTSPSGSDSL